MKLKIALASLALTAAMAIPAVAQNRGWYDQNGVYHQDRDNDHDRDNRNRDYDRDHDRWHREHDRNRNNGNNGYYNGQYNNGAYGNGGYNNGSYNSGYANPGFQMGMRDGLNDGQTARMRGNSSYGPGWKHPDRGYNSSMGDKRTYEQQYRSGYQQGFQQGMNGNAYGGWRR